jgi:hypothetical protein
VKVWTSHYEGLAIDGFHQTADAAAELLSIPETEAARLLDDLEAAGSLVSATGPICYRSPYRPRMHAQPTPEARSRRRITFPAPAPSDGMDVPSQFTVLPAKAIAARRLNHSSCCRGVDSMSTALQPLQRTALSRQNIVDNPIERCRGIVRGRIRGNRQRPRGELGDDRDD